MGPLPTPERGEGMWEALSAHKGTPGVCRCHPIRWAVLSAVRVYLQCPPPSALPHAATQDHAEPVPGTQPAPTDVSSPLCPGPREAQSVLGCPVFILHELSPNSGPAGPELMRRIRQVGLEGSHTNRNLQGNTIQAVQGPPAALGRVTEGVSVGVIPMHRVLTNV